MSSVKLRLVRGTSPGPSRRDDHGHVGEDEGREDALRTGDDEPSAPSERGSSQPGLSELDDEQLVALVREGDRRGAEALYRRHAPFALNLAARIAGSTHDVEDVVHDAFLKAFDNIANLRKPSAFKGWLGSIVVHAMRSRLRRGRWLRLFGLGRGDDPIVIDHIASANASPRARAELAQLYALLKTLSPDDRIAWTLRYVEGHELRDAAELAGCSLATIKRRIARAQRYLEGHYVANSSDASASSRDERHDSEAPASTRTKRKGRGVAS